MMTPRKAKQTISSEETLVNEAIRLSQAGRFMNWFEILWPNARDILIRLAGHDLVREKSADQQRKIMGRAIEAARTAVIDSRPDLMDMVGRDRLVLMFFLQSVFRSLLYPNKKSLALPDDIDLGLSSTESGSVRVVLISAHKQAQKADNAPKIQALLDGALSHRDRLVLGDDLQILKELIVS